NECMQLRSISTVSAVAVLALGLALPASARQPVQGAPKAKTSRHVPGKTRYTRRHRTHILVLRSPHPGASRKAPPVVTPAPAVDPAPPVVEPVAVEPSAPAVEPAVEPAPPASDPEVTPAVEKKVAPEVVAA